MKELLPYLPNVQEVVLPGIAPHGNLLRREARSQQPADQHLLRSGKVDDSLYHPETVDFTPAWTFGDVAKVSSHWRWRRRRRLCSPWSGWPGGYNKRGRFGGNASAVLRSAYPIILSVGGWLLGALIVLATMPSVPVDDELLVALSAGWPGTLSADQFTRSESAMIRSRRHCNTMGTASTGARRRGARHGRPGRRRHTRG
jgi:hypothetical protein